MNLLKLSKLEEISDERTRAVLGAWTEKPTSQTKVITDQYKKAYKDITADLKKAYDKLSGISPDDAGYYNALIKYGRLESLQKQIAKLYSDSARKAGLAQVELSKTGMSNTYYQNMYSVSWFNTTQSEFFVPLDDKALDVAVFGTDEIWASINKSTKLVMTPLLPKHGTLINTLRSNRDKDLMKLKQVLIESLRNGDSYTKTASKIKDILNTSANNAIRIARTEGNRTLNAGSYWNSVAASEAGIGIQRMYIAVHDSRTRMQSASMDGQTKAIDKPFVYPNGATSFTPGNSGVAKYDINDRCRAIDIVDGVSPEARTGRVPVGENKGEREVTSFELFGDWMKRHGVKYNKSGRIV